MGAGTPCGRCRWGLRYSSLWGHETSEGCAMVVLPLGPSPEACEGCADTGAGKPSVRWLGLSVELPVGPRIV
eukprot:4965271-Pyramimonas_sp.AAC.1